MKGTSIHTRYLGQHIEPEAAAGGEKSGYFLYQGAGEDCFESDEYIHEALFEIGRITNIQHKKAFV